MNIGIIACCGKKGTQPAPAQDLYQSHLFRLSRQYVERHCDAWLILSAAHHVVRPGEVLAPYDVTLGRLSSEKRRHWARVCRAQLLSLYPQAQFVVLAGLDYRCALSDLPMTVPMQGMGIGKQIQWLQRQLQEKR